MTGENDAPTMLNPRYEWVEWYHRLLRIKPRHDCRAWLPHASYLREGVEAHCPACGDFFIRFNYHDDDGYGGTGEFMGWAYRKRRSR